MSMVNILGKCGIDDCNKARYLANRCREHYDDEIRQLRKEKRKQNEMV